MMNLEKLLPTGAVFSIIWRLSKVDYFKTAYLEWFTANFDGR